MSDQLPIPEPIREGGDALMAAYLYLNHAEDPTLDGMSTAMGTPKLRLIPIIGILEREGLVTRHPDDNDRIILDPDAFLP